MLLCCVSWLCARAETEWGFTRDGCGPYEQCCPSLWHSEHVGFSPGHRAFFRLARLHIRNEYMYTLAISGFFLGGLGTYRQGPQACRVRFKETLCMV